METLTDLVQSQFNDLVAQGTWLTEKTKKLAEDKIRAIIHNIGYPDFILDDNLLQSEVQGLDYKNDKFFENVLQNLRWRTNQEMGRLDERVNRTLWTATPAVVNAYYSRNRNQISKNFFILIRYHFVFIEEYKIRNTTFIKKTFLFTPIFEALSKIRAKISNLNFIRALI